MPTPEHDSHQYYNYYAGEFYQNTVGLNVSHLYPPFLSRLPRGAHILDAGCGSGRDSRAFLDQGYRITAFDYSEEMCRLASDLLGQSVQHLAFDQIPWQGEFDGIWACASFLHVPKAEIDAVLEKLVDALKPGGIFFLCFKYGELEVRHSYGEKGHFRLFNNYTEETLAKMLAAHPRLEPLEIWTTDDTASSTPRAWLDAVLKKNT